MEVMMRKNPKGSMQKKILEAVDMNPAQASASELLPLLQTQDAHLTLAQISTALARMERKKILESFLLPSSRRPKKRYRRVTPI